MPRGMRPRNILVCGIPGSGKTTFCEWLEKEKGFLHLDIDKLSQKNGTPAKLKLFGLLTRNPEAFITETSQQAQSTVIDWGFPMASLPLVRFLKKSGVEIWWFDGNRTAAEQAFTNRGTVSLGAFHAQMKSIEEHWTTIEGLVRGRVIPTVSADPTHAAPEWIFRKMLRKK